MVSAGRGHTHGTKSYHHPLVGDLHVAYESFQPLGDTAERRTALWRIRAKASSTWSTGGGLGDERAEVQASLEM
ncbi:hypothetical protein [Streptomyces sp. NBC_00268]|uniref:hypothetical protein n=1 Tax=Streptomyces sp. NBC_00268 TaxID=2975695 RepID=UPI002257CEAF|nr:hypothetical protein [Streptomyces sp. NBC_00268]MCX5190097.1 hypothetical protein [Streptomyces sp. NBC_00268]